MQGIAIASPTPAAAGTNTAAGSADDAASGQANLFGAILAGHLKGRTMAVKIGADGQLGQVDIGKALAEKGKSADGGDLSIARDALADMLALANSGLLPIAVQQPIQVEGAVSAEAGVSAEGQSLLAEIGQGGQVGEDVGKLRGASKKVDVVARGDADPPPLADVPVAGGDNVKLAEIAGNGKTQPVQASVVDGALKAPREGKEKDFSASLELAVSSQASAPAEAGLQNAVMQMAQVGAPRQEAVSQSQLNAIAPQVGSNEWSGALGDKVTWMASQGTQVAELQLNPPNLGPLEVRLTMNGDQLSNVVFVSHQPAVREAIETAMPRLREMLADSGIMLGNSMVGAESFQQQQQAHSQKSGGGGKGNAVESDSQGSVAGLDGTSAGAVQSRSGRGMVDMFV
ncbi:MAG: flagellar hook-length control protein FliK [Sulfuricella sp.]|nr:flagellar hook-length control protein FliK [Sulfuricella sp.]